MYLANLKTRREWKALGRKVRGDAKPWAWKSKSKAPLFDQRQLEPDFWTSK